MRLFFVALLLPAAALANSTGAPYCAFRPDGHVDRATGSVPDFTPTAARDVTFDVKDGGQIVTLTVKSREAFKGILVTTNFADGGEPDTSLGEWDVVGQKFKPVEGSRGICGVTHADPSKKKAAKFRFRKNGDAYKRVGFRVLIVTGPREVFHQFVVNPADYNV